MGYNIISLFFDLISGKIFISDYIPLDSIRMASRSSSSAKYISYYIYNFRTSSILVYTRCVRSGSFYIHFLEISKRCAACAGMS